MPVAPAYNTAKPLSDLFFQEYQAIWDTGATHSVITEKVVTECGLKPYSACRVQTANGSIYSPIYLINLLLPNNAGMVELDVTRANLEGEADVLIGMDVIGNGDFAITNKSGKTIFSFRIPSMESIDFTQE